jgi:hypothetical protein
VKFAIVLDVSMMIIIITFREEMASIDIATGIDMDMFIKDFITVAESI